jgi:drug/metabolite transporter (DMT)-like permease
MDQREQGWLKRIERLPIAPELAIGAVVLVWSSTAVVIKDTYDHISPLAFTSVRFVVICLIAAVIMGLHRLHTRSPIRIDRADYGRMIVCGLTGYTLYQLCYIIGLERTTAFASSILGSLTPIFAMFILTLLGERSPLLMWIGVSISFAGAVVFIAGNGGEGGGSLLGNLLCAAAPCAFAVYTIISRPLTRKYSAPVFSFWTLLIGSIPIWIVGAPDTAAQNWSSVPVTTWLIFAYLCIFPVYLAYQLWNYGIKHRGVTTTSAYSLVIPVLGGIWAVLWFNESFDAIKLAGATLVMAGLVVMRRAPKQPSIKPALVATGGTTEAAVSPAKAVIPGRVSEAVVAGE